MTLTLDPSQKRAVDLVCSATLGLITGGPGTGKSTTLGHALNILDKRGESYELAAPTGKAAKRVHEVTGRAARTIHRLLEYSPCHQGWQRNRSNPLTCSVVIVDESSMIDIELAAALTNAIDPTRTRLIMIGDADQLPPVGPGRVFGDLVDSGLVPTVRLDTLHRAALESWVCQNAPRVLTGDMLDLTPRPDFLWVEVAAAAEVLTHVQHMIVELLPQYGGGAEAQTLIPQRPGVAGIIAANRLLQSSLNPRGTIESDKPYLQRGQPGDDRTELRVGDRVIQTRNDYTIEVFNGEVGQITDIAHGHVCVDFIGREVVTYTLEQANALELAYALTVHRAQGSEFPWVVVVCHSTHSYVLSRQLLYTAITRAKVGVVLIGDDKGLRRALSDARPPTRNTTLVERIRAHLGTDPTDPTDPTAERTPSP